MDWFEVDQFVKGWQAAREGLPCEHESPAFQDGWRHYWNTYGNASCRDQSRSLDRSGIDIPRADVRGARDRGLGCMEPGRGGSNQLAVRGHHYEGQCGDILPFAPRRANGG